jgi:hypothetical protein
MHKILAYLGKGLAAIVGALILFVAVVSLISGPTAGAKAGYSVLHFGLVSTGVVISYADNVGPDLQQGKDLGNKVSCPAGATKCP